MAHLLDQGPAACYLCLYQLIPIMSIDKSKSNMDDIKYVEEAEETEPASADRKAEEKALVRKIDITLLPCIWIMYLLSYMDVRQTPPDANMISFG